MILTLAETKSYLNISDSSLDTDITRLIPIVQNQVVSTTMNDFQTSYDLDILSMGTDKVSVGVTYSNLIEATDDIFIVGTIRNNGHWEVASVSSNEITITGVVEEPVGVSGEIQKLTLVNWPEHLKYVASQMVLWHTKTEASGGTAAKVEAEKSSETMDDYSVSYAIKASTGSYNYPQYVIKDLIDYTRNVKVY